VNAWQIGLIVWLALGALLQVVFIGKQRKPTTPGAAAVYLLITAALIYVVVRA
jgi:peptidoglycan/LPS O-acetylase OafA/YrhL